MWRRLADPALWPNERLFFEIYALALQGRPGTAGFLDDIVDAWIGPIAEWAVQHGRSSATARAEARLGIAVCRGLLLDLLATGDRAAGDAVLERHVCQHEAVGASEQARADELSAPPASNRSRLLGHSVSAVSCSHPRRGAHSES